MISGVLSMTLVSHVSFSIKYAYSSNYETNIAEKTKWITIIIIIIIIFFLFLCVNFEFLASQP